MFQFDILGGNVVVVNTELVVQLWVHFSTIHSTVTVSGHKIQMFDAGNNQNHLIVSCHVTRWSR